jgi:hypothetical protein
MRRLQIIVSALLLAALGLQALVQHIRVRLTLAPPPAVFHLPLQLGRFTGKEIDRTSPDWQDYRATYLGDFDFLSQREYRRSDGVGPLDLRVLSTTKLGFKTRAGCYKYTNWTLLQDEGPLKVFTSIDGANQKALIYEWNSVGNSIEPLVSPFDLAAVKLSALLKFQPTRTWSYSLLSIVPATTPTEEALKPMQEFLDACSYVFIRG